MFEPRKNSHSHLKQMIQIKLVGGLMHFLLDNESPYRWYHHFSKLQYILHQSNKKCAARHRQRLLA